MSLTLIIFFAAGFFVAVGLGFLFLTKKMETGMRVFWGIVAVLCCEVLFFLFSLTLTFKANISSVVSSGLGLVKNELTSVYPGIMDESLNLDQISSLLSQVDLDTQIEKNAGNLGSLEKKILKTVIRRVFPVTYGIETASGTLNSFLEKNSLDTGAISINEIFSKTEENTAKILGKIALVFQIILVVVFVLFVVLFWVITNSFKKRDSSGKKNKAITFGEDLQE